MNADRTIQNRLFDIAWIIFVFTQLITLTGWYALNESGLKVMAYKGSTAVTCALCAAVIIINLVKRVYPVRTLICYIVFALISGVSWYFNRNTLLIVTVLLFMAAYELSGRRVITLSVVITGVVLGVTIILAELGLTYNYVFSVASNRPRYGLGFLWASNAPTLLFFLVLQYIFLRKARMRIWEYVIFEAVNVYVFMRTDTNIPFYLMTMILVFFAIEGAFRNHYRFLGHLKILYWLAPLLICTLTIILFVAIDPESEPLGKVWQAINSFLNHRLRYARNGVELNGITMFGAQIEWAGSTITGDVPYEIYNYVDCSYVRNLLDYGVVYLTAIVAVYTRMIVRAVRKTDFWLVLIAVMVLVHSITEPRLIDLSFNVIPLLAFLKLGEEQLEFRKGMLKTVFAGEHI